MKDKKKTNDSFNWVSVSRYLLSGMWFGSIMPYQVYKYFYLDSQAKAVLQSRENWQTSCPYLGKMKLLWHSVKFIFILSVSFEGVFFSFEIEFLCAALAVQELTR